MSRRNSACNYFTAPYPYTDIAYVDFTLCTHCGWNRYEHQSGEIVIDLKPDALMQSTIDTSKVMPTLTETPKFSSNTCEPKSAEILPDYSREESWGEFPDLPKRQEFELVITEISDELYRQIVNDTIRNNQPILDELKRRGD